MEFVIFGETKNSHIDIKNKILEMGGKIGANVQCSTAAIITNDNFDPKSLEQQIEEARKHQIHLISEEYLDEVMDNDPIKLIVEKSLCTWGKDVCIHHCDKQIEC